MKYFLAIGLCCLLITGCKKDDTPDPYTGTFQIKFMAGSTLLYLNNGDGYTSISTSIVEWKIEKIESGHYTITPVSDQSRILSTDGSYAALITHPAVLTDNELFSFEPDASNNDLLHIKSVGAYTYLGYDYGLNADGGICCWGMGFDNKVPCDADWSGLGAVSSACQFSFELVKQ
jgi:hypothetical protein